MLYIHQRKLSHLGASVVICGILNADKEYQLFAEALFYLLHFSAKWGSCHVLNLYYIYDPAN